MLRTIPFHNIFNRINSHTITISGVSSIDSCLIMLISTCRGELLGDPEFGTDIKKYTMNYNGSLLYDKIREDVVKAIENYEKRILVSESDISFRRDYKDENILYIGITYIVKSTNERNSVSITLNQEDINEY